MPHTPGPWKLPETIQPPAIELLNEDHTRWIATVKYPKNPKEQEENLANATLIAAAPDLLAALEKTLDCLTNWMEIQDESEARDYDDDAVRDAQAAIAKALGTKSV